MRFGSLAISFLLLGNTGAFVSTRCQSTQRICGSLEAQERINSIPPVLSASNSEIDTLTVTSVRKTSSTDSSNNTYQRDENWLENATEDILDMKLFPLGSLTVDDVESIIGLMTAWARRQNVEAALIVENLLKRVIDDMKAGNRGIYTTTRLYTVAIDAWARSGGNGSAKRAQSIHDGIVAMYKETGDEQIAPTLISYNTVMYAWSRCPEDDAPRRGELLLEEMLQAYQNGNTQLKPDAVTFSSQIENYARHLQPQHVERAEKLFHMMDNLEIKRTVYSFAALQNVYAKCSRSDGPTKTEDLLLEMINKNDPTLQPYIMNYNAVLNALSRTPSIEGTQKAESLLDQMMLPVANGGYAVEPDRMSYILTIYAGSRCPDVNYGAQVAEKALMKLEERALLEWQKKRDISSAAPLNVYLDVECYNPVLQVISKSDQDNLVSKVDAIVNRMEKLAELGHDVLPSRRTWNAVLHAYSRSPDAQSAPKAEFILNRMWNRFFTGITLVKPDTSTYAAVLQAFQKSVNPSAAQRADDILRQFEEHYAAGHMDSAPDVVHYTIVLAAWAKSQKRGAAARCAQIVAHMTQRHNSGFPNVKPNKRTYNALLDAVSRSRDVDRAEQILYYMINLSKNGETDVAPDSFSFNSAIIANCRSNQVGAGQRAEAILERMIEYNDEEGELHLESRSFTHIIGYYARSNSADSPYRAEYILKRMIDMYQSGRYPSLEPNNFAFIQTIDAYAYTKHRDAGEVAERLLKIARDLINKYGCTQIEINSELLNTVLLAWSSSGDKEAGRKAEIHLESMERQYAAGNQKNEARHSKLWTRSECMVKK